MTLTQALATADRSGYTLLPWPTRAPAGVTQKLRRLRSERGEAEAGGSVNAGWPGCDQARAMQASARQPDGGRLTPRPAPRPPPPPQACLPPDERAGGPLGALHAAQWVQEAQLPLRYAFVVEPPAGGQGEGGPHFCASEVWTDDGSCWEALRAVAALSVALSLPEETLLTPAPLARPPQRVGAARGARHRDGGPRAAHGRAAADRGARPRRRERASRGRVASGAAG